MTKRLVFLTAAVLTLTIAVHAEVQVSNLFSDNLVLQRDLPAPVWGTAAPAEKVTVKLGSAEASAVADAAGKWLVRLPALKMSATPQELTITGKNTLTVRNVLVGDVWLCSGQSNMEFGLGSCNAKEDIDAADYPALRRLKFDHIATGVPGRDVPRKWEVCTPQTAAGFTAVGFYFARRIQKETGVPIGLLDNNWGGTRIEPWIPPCGFEMEPSLTNLVAEVKRREAAYRNELAKVLDPLEKWVPLARQALATPGAELPPPPSLPGNPGADPGSPLAIYNGQICPIVPFGIKGALWYQGESNGGEGDEYAAKMRALIGGWRQVWNQPPAAGAGAPGREFPFYFVQLANFQQPNESPAGGDGWARIRMAQFQSLQVPHTGMAVAIDLADAGNPGDIHPKNKFDVGERLALWALARDYGQKDLVCSGPLYKAMKIEPGKIRLQFDHVGRGLMVGRKEGRQPTVEDKEGALKRFAIAGADKNWVWAEAAIDGATVVVSSPAVPEPVAVRYAYTMNPAGCNLYNQDGLPASPFRTDNW